MLQKLRQWIRKLSFPISLLLMGVLFFTWTDNWQVYTDPLRELYNRGVQLAAAAGWVIPRNPDNRTEPYRGIRSRKAQKIPRESRTPAVGETSADTQTETMTTEEPQPTEPSEELPKEVVYHTGDDAILMMLYLSGIPGQWECMNMVDWKRPPHFMPLPDLRFIRCSIRK